MKTKNIVAVTVALSFLACSCTLATNCGGVNHAAAVKNAEAFKQEMGIPSAHVSCAHADSDGDGYVSCSLSHEKVNGDVQVIPLECAAALSMNSGCRAARVIPVNGQ